MADTENQDPEESRRRAKRKCIANKAFREKLVKVADSSTVASLSTQNLLIEKVQET